MKKLMFSIALVMTSACVLATELRVGHHYIANANFSAKIVGDPNGATVELQRENRLEIVRIDGKIVTLDVTSKNSTQDAKIFDHFFVVNTDDVDLDIYLREWDAVGHGVLVVPFKVSFKDASLSSQSVTLGYYLQYPRWLTSGGVAHGPIYSAGLASITRSEEENTELGVSAALGYVISIHKDFQVGLVVGIDHLGDDSWQYEDKGWASLMVGFNFLQ